MTAIAISQGLETTEQPPPIAPTPARRGFTGRPFWRRLRDAFSPAADFGAA